MSWLKRLFGKAEAEENDKDSQVTAEPSKSASWISGDDPRASEGQDRVLAYWKAVGSVEDNVVSYIVNPMFLGAPAWPNTRQAYRVIRTDDSMIIASDGLSDPFVDSENDTSSGFGLEVFIEILDAQDLSFDKIMGSPEFNLIELVAQNIAGHGGIAELLDEVGVLSMAVPISHRFPEHWHDTDGQVGVLLGLPVPKREKQIDLPFGPCRFVAVTPILPVELQAVAGSKQERDVIAKKYSKSAPGWRFDLKRTGDV